MEKTSIAYRMLFFLGIKLSPKKYGKFSLFSFINKALILWKNEALHKLARNSVVLCPAPLNSRLIRPLLHRLRGVNIGKNVFIGLEVIFDSIYSKKIHIGDRCIITNGVKILCHNRDLTNYNKSMKVSDLDYIVSDVVIENDVTIGTGAIILPGVTIGKGSVVAAGAVVSIDVEPFTMVAGIPAKVIKKF